MTDTDLVHEALSEVWESLDDFALTVVHGGARGADRMAGEWAKLMRSHGVKEEVHNADWRKHGRAAGPIRNQEMLSTGIDLVLAFYKGGAANIGTSDMVKRAKLARVTVVEYTQT